VDGVGLSSGTNWLTVSVMDAWSNVVTTNIVVVKSDVALSVSVPTNSLHKATIDLTGTINTNYTVWVNGVPATNHGDGTWGVTNVVVSEGPTALFTVIAAPSGESSSSANAVQTTANTDKPMRLWVASDAQGWSDLFQESVWIEEEQVWKDYTYFNHYDHGWRDKSASRGNVYRELTTPIAHETCAKILTWPPVAWEHESIVTGNEHDYNGCTGDYDYPAPVIGLEHCDIKIEYAFSVLGVLKISEHYERKADTVVKFFSGGRPFPFPFMRDPQIGVFSGSAQKMTCWSIKPENPGFSGPDCSAEIAPSEVTLGDFGRLGADGSTYKRVQDGKTYDITPKVKGRDFYKFQVGLPSKHIFKHDTVEPEDVAFTKLPEEWHVINHTSAGFHALVTILPTDVSFSRVEFSELDCVAVADGCFASHNGDLHLRWEDQCSGGTCGSWLSPSCDNNLPSYTAGAVDWVQMAATNSCTGTGSFTWNIPWNWRPIGDEGDGNNFKDMPQIAASNNGSCTVTKCGVTNTFANTDPTLIWGTR
jgi:hypothetical protein